MTAATERETVWQLFGPCREGQHSECLVAFDNWRCSCDCGHESQKERETK